MNGAPKVEWSKMRIMIQEWQENQREVPTASFVECPWFWRSETLFGACFLRATQLQKVQRSQEMW